jgi:tol-pal system protein YbgF
VARRLALAFCPLLLGLGTGCALKGDVRKVELQVQALQASLAQRDSARAAAQDSILATVRAVQQALATQQAYLVQLRGDVRTELLSVQQQLVAVQELTGQSQQRLTELRTRLEVRGAQIESGPVPGDTAAPVGGAATASADQMYEASLAQLRRGSPSTARLGLREMLRTHPTSARAPDALYFIGQSYASENPDSAAAYYGQVAEKYPQSPRAASAVYNLGLLAERRKDTARAREAFQRVVQAYPQSDEAALARDRLKALGR